MTAPTGSGQLADLLTADRVKVPLAASSKDEVLRELVALAAPHADAAARDAITDAVRERERLLSTGIGGGIAIPHGRTPAVEALTLAAGVTRAPIPFDALDGQPVSLFFLLLGPEHVAGAHVKALGRISRLLRHESVRIALQQAPDARAFLERLSGAEAA
ncbi:MAG: PTS sugar transporter subunit IIA [Gemmatimonadaceae bacterium]|nr:PTS sugar transporter subunit IIA [Gemmatimonadaceae bacterium]